MNNPRDTQRDLNRIYNIVINALRPGLWVRIIFYSYSGLVIFHLCIYSLCCYIDCIIGQCFTQDRVLCFHDVSAGRFPSDLDMLCKIYEVDTVALLWAKASYLVFLCLMSYELFLVKKKKKMEVLEMTSVGSVTF